MHRPLVGIALCAVLGTWLGFATRLPPLPLCAAFALTALLSLLAGALRRAPERRPPARARATRRALAVAAALLVCACAILAAWVSATLSRTRLSTPLPHAAPGRSGDWELIGRVAGDSETTDLSGRAWAVHEFPLNIENARFGDASWQSASGRVNVRWYGPPPARAAGGLTRSSIAPLYGERWRMRGSIADRRHGYRKAPVPTFSTGRRTSERLSPGSLHGIGRFVLAARKTAAGRLAVGIENHPETISILRALLLGYRGDLSAEMRELFSATGTLHIFAISGLHVGIIGGLLIFLLSVLGVPRTAWIPFLAPLLIAYTFSTGANPSAVRACIMAMIYFGAPFARRRADSLSALSLAALLILAWSPEQLFQAGFVLSFTVVLGLILLYTPTYNAIERAVRRFGILTETGGDSVMPLFWERDPAQVQDEGKTIRGVRRVARYVASLFALSCAAWLASAPLTAYYFGRFAPVALLGNVLVIPLAFLVVLAGALSLALGALAPLLADIFNHANLLLVSTLVHGLRLMARIPGGSLRLPPPPPWAVALGYALLAAAVFTLGEHARTAKGMDNREGKWDDSAP